MDSAQIEIIGRLLAAAAVGLIIGLNRDLNNKPIGSRTLALVALGAAAVVTAVLRYEPIAGSPEAIARVLQGSIEGVLTGIGFIGAGVILRDRSRQTVHGLTTAATVWVTAGLGLVCGIADWFVVGATVILALIILVVLLKIEEKLADEPGQR